MRPRKSRAAENWRQTRDVLVVQAESMGAVAVIRSLGRAGYRVHACAQDAEALGLHSKFASARVVCPQYEDSHFLPWLRAYLAQHDISAIVPSEGLLLALRPCLQEFLHLLPVCGEPSVLYTGMSKVDLFRSLLSSKGPAGQHLPPTQLIEGLKQAGCAVRLQGLGKPLFVKVDGLHALHPEPGFVKKAADALHAEEVLHSLRHRFSKALVQGHVPGQGVGAFFLIWRGEVLAEFMHLRVHEVPHTGGVSSLRKSFQHAPIRQDALAKLRLLGWEGVAMMEYRWDPRTDAFYFLEMNGRFWGSLHLALWAGVDFPALLMDAFFGHPRSAPVARENVLCRHTFPAEVQHVWSKLKDRDLSWSARVRAVLEFATLSLDPRVHSDLLFPKDQALYWREFRQFLSTLGSKTTERGRVGHGEPNQEDGVSDGQMARHFSAVQASNSKTVANSLLSRHGSGG